jgi:hypothetical protein
MRDYLGDWAKRGEKLPGSFEHELAKPLAGRDGGTAFYQALRDVAFDFLKLYLKVSDNKDVADVVQRRTSEDDPQIIVAAVDATCRGKKDATGKQLLTVTVSLQLLRLDVEKTAPFSITRMEKLFMGVAEGCTPLTTDKPTGEEAMQTVRSAAVDAFRDKLAIYFWGNPLVREHSWIGRGPEQKVPIVGTAKVEGGGS